VGNVQTYIIPPAILLLLLPLEPLLLGLGKRAVQQL
jgi:hypothetical protein